MLDEVSLCELQTLGDNTWVLAILLHTRILAKGSDNPVSSDGMRDLAWNK